MSASALVGWLRLNANYHEDPAVHDLSDLAELLWLRGLALAKRAGAAGFIDRRQLPIILPDGCAGETVDELVKAELWLEDAGGWSIRSWAKWNGEPDDARVAGQRRAAQQTNHDRWHVKRGVVDPDCPLCSPVDESVPVTTDSTDGAPTNDRQSTDFRADAGFGSESAGQDRSGSVGSLTDQIDRRDKTRRDISLAPAAADASELRGAVIEVCGLNPADITPPANGSLGKALSDLRSVGATVDQVHGRAAAYRKKWPAATLTPPALAKNWAALRDSTPQPSKPAETIEGWRSWGAQRAIAISTEDELRDLMGPAAEDHQRAALEGWSESRVAAAS